RSQATDGCAGRSTVVVARRPVGRTAALRGLERESRAASEEAAEPGALLGTNEEPTGQIAHERIAAAFLPARLERLLLRAAGLVVQERELGQHPHVPPPGARTVLVDAVPAHRRAQPADVLEAGDAIRL